uniref:snRNA-activating protein complex subunit 3 n=1 Tax=Rhabditophanes sp. KR3021 TaxID=114890 RepID=A0AC35TRJ3_9BILA
MTCDNIHYINSMDSISIPLKFSHFKEYANEATANLKYFLKTGDILPYTDHVANKLKEKLNFTDVQDLNSIDKLHLSSSEDDEIPPQDIHPKNAAKQEFFNSHFLSSAEETDFEFRKQKQKLKNKHYSLQSHDASTDNDSDRNEEMPANELRLNGSKRKKTYMHDPEIDRNLNKVTKLSFDQTKVAVLNNFELTHDICYQKYNCNKFLDLKFHKLAAKGVDALSMPMDVPKVKDGFLRFIENMGLDRKIGRAASKNVVIAMVDSFVQSPKVKGWSEKFDATVHLEYGKARYLLQQKVLNSDRLSFEKKKSKYYHVREQLLMTSYPEFPLKYVPNDFVVTVTLFKPMMSKWKSPNNHKKSIPFSREKQFLVRGDTTLLELRDKFLCQWDLVCPNEFDQGLPQPKDCFAKRIPSSLIFIHDTFYVDTTRNNSTDIVAPLKKFCDKRKLRYKVSPHIKCMKTTKMNDITARINQPYLYYHMGGNCEHTFTFNNIRMMGPNDYQNIENYPLLMYELIPSKKCGLCHKNTPIFVINEDDRLTKVPILCCQECFNWFYLDKNGKRQCKFSAMYFVDKNFHSFE